MGVSVFLCIVLLSLIAASKTWPHETADTSAAKTDDESASRVNSKMQNAASPDQIARGGADDEGDIIFPDDESRKPVSTETRAVFPATDFVAEGKGLKCIENVCEDAMDYPYEHVKNVLKNLHHLKVFGGLKGVTVDHHNRLKPDDPDEKAICDVATHTKFPKTMRNERNITKYIVNDELNKQGIVFETCRNESECPVVQFPQGYKGVCRQKHSRVRLLAIAPDNKGEPAFDDFITPSCCVCIYKKD